MSTQINKHISWLANSEQQLCKDEKSLFICNTWSCNLEGKRVGSIVDQAIIDQRYLEEKSDIFYLSYTSLYLFFIFCMFCTSCNILLYPPLFSGLIPATTYEKHYN